MIFSETFLKGSYVIDLEPYIDDRGWFVRYYDKDEFKKIGFDKEWVQMNHSVTYKAGSIRGIHYQLPPFREIKLVRCIAGSVYDVIIDIRKDSSTFLNWYGVELSAENKKMLYIPEGFAHGFQCMTDNCQLLYHHSEVYRPDSEGGIKYNDTLIRIEWPLPVNVISERDKNHSSIDKSFKGI